MKTENLTIETVQNLMDASYNLVYVDRTENLNNSLGIISKCLKQKSAAPLYEAVSDWHTDAELAEADRILEELQNKCSEQGRYTDADIFFGSHRDEIIGQIYERDNSDTIGQLIRNSRDIPVRIEMQSNYDCINSHWFEGSYHYYETYFGAMVDALNLNPVKMQLAFKKAGIKTEGHYPNKRNRNGKEWVSYEAFAEETQNSTAPANVLTFMATIKLSELLSANFDIREVVIPKGNRCGIFSRHCGGGSLMEMELTQAVTLKLDAGKYDYFSLKIDHRGDEGYSIEETFGVMLDFFGKQLTVNKQIK